MKMGSTSSTPAKLFFAFLLLVLVAGGSLGPASEASAQSEGFSNPAFRRAWERTDKPVAESRVNRTWVWGPVPGKALAEPFKEGPGGIHQVQYFDKARMEINDPSGNPNDPFFVTNGLLVVEMISGRVQTGVSQFEAIGASDVRIAGDEGSDAPTYGALQRVASVGVVPGDNRATALTTGAQMQVAYMGQAGVTSLLSTAPGPVPSLKAAAFVGETGHNIPDVFWSYLNSEGPVYENGAYANGRLVRWESAFGFPITEPYWTQIKVGGRDRLVMFQAFQRRILTYSPQNADGWKVEVGNVGQQYYAWRYLTPTLGCAKVPVRGFGRVWANYRAVQRGLGCISQYAPFDKELAVQTAYQPFENGAMLWISRTLFTQERLIYVFFNDGKFQLFDDTWREGETIPASTAPPPGRYEPVRGFGKVWREGTGAKVKERLGWATAPEKGGPGAYQRFARGEMYWSQAVDNIWVLYGSINDQYGSPAPPIVPPRYESYKDTF